MDDVGRGVKDGGYASCVTFMMSLGVAFDRTCESILFIEAGKSGWKLFEVINKFDGSLEY